MRGARRAAATTGRLDGVEDRIVVGERGGDGDLVDQVAGHSPQPGVAGARPGSDRRPAAGCEGGHPMVTATQRTFHEQRAEPSAASNTTTFMAAVYPGGAAHVDGRRHQPRRRRLAPQGRVIAVMTQRQRLRAGQG